MAEATYTTDPPSSCHVKSPSKPTALADSDSSRPAAENNVVRFEDFQADEYDVLEWMNDPTLQ